MSVVIFMAASLQKNLAMEASFVFLWPESKARPPVHEPPAGLDQGGGVGQQKLDGLMLDKRFSKGLTLSGIGNGVIERPFGEAEGKGGHRRAGHVEITMAILNPSLVFR